MKRVYIIISVIVLSLLLCSCGKPSSSSSTYPTSTYSTSSGESTAAMKVTSALSKELKSKYKDDYVDHSATRYNVASSEHENGKYVFRGTYTLYDKYGKIYGNHINEKFTVEVDEKTYSTKVTLN